MRNGFTTGSCAAAASKAAVYMLITGKEKKSITIDTPAGIPYEAEILDIKRDAFEVSCAVKKDSGDDPDVTNGMPVYSAVSFFPKRFPCYDGKMDDNSEQAENVNTGVGVSVNKDAGAYTDVGIDYHVLIEGGPGVGRVTKPGLDRKVGEAAINSVPRQMIEKEIREVCDFFDIKEDVHVVISVPGGEEIARKTFNPKLGIEGGISIIGTSGIVEPMSTRAILDTIRLELKQRKELGFDYVAVSPGNYGLDFMRDTYGYDLDQSVKCSNYIGSTVDMAVETGFREILFVGHVGKLIKVAGGIMNTHSKEADCRMEIFSAIGIRHSVPYEVLLKIQNCVTTEEVCKLLKECGKCDEVCLEAAERICSNLGRRSGDKIKTECIVFSKELGELAKSDGAGALLKKLTSEKDSF